LERLLLWWISFIIEVEVDLYDDLLKTTQGYRIRSGNLSVADPDS
jgi:hypothetical protein